MPKIPIFESNQSIPGVSGAIPGNFEAGGMEYKALQNLGNTMTDQGARAIYLTERYETLKNRAKSAVEQMSAQVGYEKDFMNWQENELPKLRPEEYAESHQRFVENAIPKAVDLISNPNEKEYFAQKLQMKAMQHGVMVNRLARQREKEEIQYTIFNEHTPEFQNLIANAEGPEIASAWGNMFSDELNEQVRTGIITGEQARAELKKALMGGDLARAERKILTNPAYAYKELTEENFPYLDSVKILKLKEHAQDVLFRESQRYEHMEKEKQREAISGVISKLYDLESSNAPAAAYTKLIREIDSLKVNKVIDPIEALRLRNQVDRGVTGDDNKTDMKVFADISLDSSKVRNGEITRQDQIDNILKAQREGKLSRGDAKLLLNQARTDEMSSITIERKAIREFENQKDREMRVIKETMEKEWGDLSKSGRKERLGRAIWELEQAAKTVDDAKYFPWLKDYANKLVEWNKSGTVSSVKNNLFGTPESKPVTTTPQVTVIETRRGKDGAILERLSDGTIRKR